ncbi:MAG: DUF1365 domain-containing protein [Oceanospirillaceae bacterium]|nr:DUF1365 domain-containing protein [Oceanospirillaceae bacterium]MCP5335490.1 DUF1365 domain-containing protein [Oceanospirillaceae bacterium]MCP5349961.1 DUF1365 domain-containing protein [Oceanospirillaceae bacterium]
MNLSSRLYQGWVRHRRFKPIEHGFSYPLFMTYLDLDEIDSAMAQHPLWSAKRFNLARFCREDYLQPLVLPLRDALQQQVAENTGGHISGPVRLLTHLRYFGFNFNPVSFYFCFDQSGEQLELIVAEITNTPWSERHRYFLTTVPEKFPNAIAQNIGTKQTHIFDFAKAFHVSPFNPMHMHYRWSFKHYAGQIVIHMENTMDGAKHFDATLNLEEKPMNRRSMGYVLRKFPLMTLKVVWRIYWQALRLWLKRAPFYDHPASQPNK